MFQYLIAQNQYTMAGVSLDLCEHIPGKESDRNSFLGEIFWIYTAITETIAWCVLSSTEFQKYLRQELLTSALIRCVEHPLYTY